MPIPYLDFEIEIGRGDGRTYPISVVHSPAGETRAQLTWPFGQYELENKLLALQNVLLRSGGTHRRALTPDEMAVQSFGAKLFDTLFVDEVRSRYDVSRQMATNKAGLRIKLRIHAPELAALPWEYLYDPRQSEYLCLSRHTPLIRYLDLARPVPPLTVKPPLCILGMIASPDGLPPLDVQVEKQRMERGLAKLVDRGLVALTWLDGQSWRDLQRVMRQGPWHIFHFMGHGGFDEQRGEGVVMLTDDTGKPDPLTATQLAQLLTNQRSLRLALFNSCEGAKADRTDVFSSTAATLVKAGLPAVLAMQYEITDKAASEFAGGFYEALADNLPVDAAVAEARMSMNLGVRNSLEWGTPVLFMRSSDGQVFDLEAKSATASATRPAPVSALAAEPEAEPVAEPSTAQTSGTKRSWWTWAGLALVAVMVVMAVFYWPRFFGDNGSPDTGLALSESSQPGIVIGPLTNTPELTHTPTRIPTAKNTPPPTRPQTPSSTTANTPFPTGWDTRQIDDITFVFVPAGEFIMGSNERDDEKPIHTVYVDGYWIMRTEVTNAQFGRFIDTNGYTTERYWTAEGWTWRTGNDVSLPSQWTNNDFNGADYPVVGVSWYEAVAYANWLSERTGIILRLPTEAEWEKAARGTDGRIYPWGNEWDGSHLMNYCDINCTESWKDMFQDDGYQYTAPVNSYPNGASVYGAMDMAGNVWEWVQDWYDSGYYANSPVRNPVGPETGDNRVMRGGSWYNGSGSMPSTRRLSYASDNRYHDMGFRLVAPGF